MQQRKLPRLSLNSSKKLGRRLRVTIEWIRGNSRSLYPFIILILFLFLAHSLFLVKKIECRFNSEPCPQVILEKLDSVTGTNSFFINQRKLIDSIEQVHPIDSVSVGFKLLNTLSITIHGNKTPHLVEIVLVQDLPTLEIDLAAESTAASEWAKPSTEIDKFLQSANSASFEMWENGTITPISTTSSPVKYVISEKPQTSAVSELYKLIVLSQKYLNLQSVFILDRRVFLRQADQPDIIVNIPFDKDLLTEAFQSIGYLATIKKDAKVIDLRFKNPIIR